MALIQDVAADCAVLNGVYCSSGLNPVPATSANTATPSSNHGAQVEQVAHLTEWIIIFVITPSVSVFAVIGNILSLIILAKHGLHKSSNILLFSLAVSDILLVLAINARPKYLYESGAGGSPYSELIVHALYFLYQLVDCLNWITGTTSASIPVLIMVERLIAVFLPLRFPSLVTVRRTVFAVIIPLVFFTLLQVYVRTWPRFDCVFDASRNMSVGIADRKHMYWDHSEMRAIIEVCKNLFFFLVFFVGCGCVAIGVKMKLVTRKRLQMTSNQTLQKATKKDAESSKTTKMLLCLCIFYTCACVPSILPAVIPALMTYPMFQDNPGVFMYYVYNVVFCINASCNFFICVSTNTKFRQTCVDILCARRCHSSRRLPSLE